LEGIKELLIPKIILDKYSPKKWKFKIIKLYDSCCISYNFT
jgi:hypothetical protein